MVKKFEDTFIRFDRIHERDGRTYGKTDTAWWLRPRLHSIARQNLSKVPYIKYDFSLNSCLNFYNQVCIAVKSRR